MPDRSRTSLFSDFVRGPVAMAMLGLGAMVGAVGVVLIFTDRRVAGYLLWALALALTIGASALHDAGHRKRGGHPTRCGGRMTRTARPGWEVAASIVGDATCEIPEPADDGKGPAAVALGRKGGLKGRNGEGGKDDLCGTIPRGQEGR